MLATIYAAYSIYTLSCIDAHVVALQFYCYKKKSFEEVQNTEICLGKVNRWFNNIFKKIPLK